ncbi:MAG TPA: IPT/TIG domain-containing protein, partial [Candidatus Solibacter sp.]|nr:IPT/TIG domain-containing protein [Candidatus Solibacter sp.]
VVNGKLPTSLDGVSVTINGKPAFVYYISSTQINVQAPSDTATGAVDVVVNNNGAISAPVEAQLQAVAPAFFTYLGTNGAIASRLPDYAPVGGPSGTKTAPAKAGDTIVLWGTGFGATIPAVGAGSAVSGAPIVANTPVVTVGGMEPRVISAVLTTGTAGLYQITVQLPAGLPSGALEVQATVGGVKSPSGVTLVVQ